MKRHFFYLCVAVALGFFLSQCTQAEQNQKQEKKEVAIQLYSVRSLLDGVNKDGQLSSDYVDVLNKLAQMGYTSVEAANYADGKFYGRAPEDFRKDVESAGMQVLSSRRFDRSAGMVGPVYSRPQGCGDEIYCVPVAGCAGYDERPGPLLPLS